MYTEIKKCNKYYGRLPNGGHTLLLLSLHRSNEEN